ncbi:hypothetical protein TWF718_007777 [Orbilia javanica]|uniref:Uncharacterized protein n=1 Tax=Orbilia javanica TaxID=47235 RepID=A0AAN8N3C7_9PEZI
MVSRSIYFSSRPVRTSYTIPYWRPTITPLPLTHPLTASLNPTLQRLGPEISYLGLKVISLNLVIQNSIPTLLITSDSPKPQNFETFICPAIREILGVKRFYAIEYYFDDRTKYIDRCRSHYRNYESIRLPGQSIGVEGIPWGTGTVGGFIQFDHPSMKNQSFGLSCHHVLQPTRPATAPKALIDQRLRHLNKKEVLHSAVRWKSRLRSKGRARVVSPASCDHRNFIHKAKLAHKKLKDEISAAKNQYWREYNQEPDDAEVRKLERASAENIKELEERDCSFGKVLVTSGYKIHPETGGSIDWGLIKMRKNILTANVLVCKSPLWKRFPEAKILSIGPLIPGQEVCKLGRSTDLTYGTVSTSLHIIDFDNNNLFTKERAIIGKHGYPFAMGGDSGSWVINKDFQVVGMLVGHSNAGVIAFVTPMEVIIKDIEAITKKKVILYGDFAGSWGKFRMGRIWEKMTAGCFH